MTVIHTINVFVAKDLVEAQEAIDSEKDIVLIRPEGGEGFTGVALSFRDYTFNQSKTLEQALAASFQFLQDWNEYVDSQLGPDYGLLP